MLCSGAPYLRPGAWAGGPLGVGAGSEQRATNLHKKLGTGSWQYCFCVVAVLPTTKMLTLPHLAVRQPPSPALGAVLKEHEVQLGQLEAVLLVL